MKDYLDQPYCHDLPTLPQPQIGKVLVTGATGYIGGRLVPELLKRCYDLRVMVRSKSEEQIQRWPNTEIVEADTLNPDSLDKALNGVKVAYYLIHSLLLGRKEFQDADLQAAINFRKACEKNKVKRIIYLGGLGDTSTKLSKHLRSRAQVAKELSNGIIPVTVLRAAIIIGSGSASYEIIKNLVKNLYIFLIPKWARTNCQPIAIRDVIKYLVGVLEIDETKGKIFDIGGPEKLSYKEMLKIFASVLHKRRLFINSIFSNRRIIGYLASLLTPVPAKIVISLFGSGANEVICMNNEIKKYLKFKNTSFSESIIWALDREEQDKMRTRWSDSYPPAHELAIKLHELPPPKYVGGHSMLTTKSATSLYNSFLHIGGEEGWASSNWMWKFRGAIDKILLGVGISRGKRRTKNLRINDVIDFWRIEDLQVNKKLLLRAEMKIPGKAWLEFAIDELASYNKLSINAYFHNKGFIGRIYWYFFLPFHWFIFRDLIKMIEKRS
ncbi:SDR family oxidoreductase [Bacteroidota bacterium]